MITDKYAKVSDKEEAKKEKTILSDDAFAICDFIEQLMNKIERVRLTLA